MMCKLLFETKMSARDSLYTNKTCGNHIIDILIKGLRRRRCIQVLTSCWWRTVRSWYSLFVPFMKIRGQFPTHYSNYHRQSIGTCRLIEDTEISRLERTEIIREQTTLICLDTLAVLGWVPPQFPDVSILW